MRQRLYELYKSTRPRPVLVVGDIILDRYLDGTVERISPEAPVQVFEVGVECESLGGAANVAVNVAAMGAKAHLVGVVGKDDGSATVRAELKKWGVPSSGVVTDPSRPTSRKTRIIALRQQMLRIDREKRHGVSGPVLEALAKKIESVIGKCSGVIVSDYGKGALPKGLLRKIFVLARKAGIPVITDPKGRDYAKYKGTTIITPNRNEAAAATGVEIKTEKDYAEAARRIFDVTGAKHVVITRGAEGMSVFDGGGAGTRFAAEALEVFDVSGAGDTVVAALGTAYFTGAPMEDAARIANVAAAIEVGHLGACAVTREEILLSLGKEGPGGGKAMSRDEAAHYAAKLRARGKRVVFTNGCFDLLHAGHVKILKEARAMGDALFVGINTDRSIRRLKGADRPLLDENDRLEILSALDCVDAVTLFGEDTPLELIKRIKPDVLVKGSDYAKSEVVGREAVEKFGGRVELAALVKGKSTSALIESILKKNKRR